MDFALLLQSFDKDSRTHMELPRKMLDAAAFVKATAADEFAFFGFGKEHVLRERFGFDFLNAFSGDCGLHGFIRIGYARLRRILFCLVAELQTRCTQRMIKHMCYCMEQCFKEF